VQGIVKWDADKWRLVMTDVPLQTEVSPGEMVVSSDLGGSFVDDIRIGRVVETTVDTNRLFNVVYLERPSYLWSLREVFIVRDVVSSPVDSLFVGFRENPADEVR
jgi:cell shape-determining protein MreC